ncbi:MAG TPA: DUF305 domain-containing protein [Gemmatimonadales bacterium]|nr:DUF305 domain-containing protein [Gemmatimonadales bacterium]
MSRMLQVLLVVTLAAAPATTTALAQTAPETSTGDYTPADVAFMSGMIYHHAQALLISSWAKSHGASPDVQVLCDRIIRGQSDEIAILSQWLADRHEAVPHPEPEHMRHAMGGHMMPGMLTAGQLAQLDSARGEAFDELFLRFMIQHHEGAITMVNDLFARGAGEENPVYKIASGVFADQTTEIERMQRMLAAMMFGPVPATTNPR